MASDPTGTDHHDDAAAVATAAGASWIADLLELDEVGPDLFVAREPEGANNNGRLFGGLIAAQALSAACRTVDTSHKLPESLHLYFVRGGQPGVDVELVVERTRDGTSFDTRRVTANQDGVAILEMLASFHRPEDGADAHPPAPEWASPDHATAVPLPPPMSDHFEFRMPGESPQMFDGPPHWVRMSEEIEDDPVIRACALTYMSDMGLMIASRPPLDARPLDGAPSGNFMVASLDHAIWFHRPFAPHEWHRYETRGLNNNDARGLAMGGFYTADGTLVASMAQEALWRL
jgi:acyl-CoA thioesterase